MKARIALVVLLAAAVAALAGMASGKSPSGSTTGTGTVFLPNPVAELQNQSLTDQKDADYAALQPAYHTVMLTDLDRSGTLTGRWAQIVSETGVPARSSTNTFTYHRNDDRFEQVMAYYWITGRSCTSRAWASEPAATRPVNMQSQRVRINQLGPGQLVRHRPPEGRAALRQGRGRRRRGRRGDPPRVRPRDPLLAELLVSRAKRRARSARVSATTGPPTSPTSSRRLPTRPASPTGTRPRTRRRRRTASVGSTRTCTTRTT